MNKRLKKVTAVVMAMGMAATGSMASYAAEEQPPAAGATKESEMNICLLYTSDAADEL